MEKLLQDIRYSVRTLLKDRGFTTVAVLTLALGIGATTAIFSVINAVILRPLAFQKPDQLVMVWEKRRQLGRERNVVSPPDFKDWREQNKVFEDMAAFSGQGFNLGTSNEPERIQGAAVSPSLFSVLRAQPTVGRVFRPDEDNPGSNSAAIISSALWGRSFASDPGIVGKTIKLNEEDYTIVGVMPADFVFPNRRSEIWVPLVLSPDDAANRGGHNLTVIGRLKDGVTLQRARTEMDAIAAQLEQQYQVNTGHGVNVFSLYEEVVAGVRPALLVLFGAVGFVLLIACANLANLLSARSTARQKEMAIRTALGAGRSRIVRQLLTESAVLAIAGGIIGVLLSAWGLDLLLAIGEDSIPRVKEIRLDGWVLGFSMLISIATGLLFGLVPALQASKPDLNEALKEGSRGASGSIRSNRTLSIFVIAEVAICLVLLIGAGLMIRSFSRLLGVSPGFDPDNVLSMNVALSGSRYREAQQVCSFYQRSLERLSSLPGVQFVGATTGLPMAGGFGSRYFRIEGRPPQPPGQGFNANVNLTTPGYFRTMKIPFIEGRDFDDHDGLKTAEAVIINKEMARRYWPDGDPIGTRLAVGDGPWRTVVGVVGDVKQARLDIETRPEMFWPYYQVPVGFTTFVVRTSSDPETITSAVREAMQQIDSDLPLYGIKPVTDVISESVNPQRLNVILLGVFAGLALALASVGLYGVISYSVSQRTREIGIRMALGASQQGVLRLVVGQGIVLALIGVAIGVVASLFLTRLMSSLLFGVSTMDPVIFIGVSVLLAAVSALASFVPARRAMKVDPMIALRYE